MPPIIALKPPTGTAKPICCTCPLPTFLPGGHLCACQQQLLQPPTTAPTAARRLPEVVVTGFFDDTSLNSWYARKQFESAYGVYKLFSLIILLALKGLFAANDAESRILDYDFVLHGDHPASLQMPHPHLSLLAFDLHGLFKFQVSIPREWRSSEIPLQVSNVMGAISLFSQVDAVRVCSESV